MPVFYALLLALLSASCLAADPVAATRAALRQAMQASAAQARPALIARAELLRPPTLGDVRLAPDGRQLSLLKLDGPRVDVWLQDVASGEQTRVIADARSVRTAWSGDGRHLWVADADGLAVVDGASRVPRRLFKWDARRAQRFWGVDARAADVAIVYEKAVAGGAEWHRYLLIDSQGRTRLLHQARWPLRSLLLDAAGRLQFAAAYDGPDYDTAIRQYTASGVRELLRCTGVEECHLAGYDPARQTLWLLSQHGEDRLALQRWQQGRWETVHRDPLGVADADGLLWSTARRDWLAMAYSGERRRWHGNDAVTRMRLAALQRRLPGANLGLSASVDGRLWLVRAQRTTWRRARHFLYRPYADQLQPLFESDPMRAGSAAEAAVAAMQPLSYRSRDGALLHGYVLLPPGVAAAEAPLVAWLHGGPVDRVHDDYDARLQLLANRGYAVFVPNFRISSGYGLDYTLSAQGDVGDGRVLADIIDGLDFLLAQGIGDRDRQAVLGHSFGGYASLLAVSHHPERFRFAFAAAPPVEYGWIKQWQSEHENESLRGGGPPVAVQFRQFGLAFEDAGWRQRMRRESPLAQLDRLRAPVYLWAGARDDRVPLKSVVHYAAEARTHGKPLSLLIDPEAGHSPEPTLAREALVYLFELAAHRHLGGALMAPSPELQALLDRNLRIDAR